MKEGFLRGLAVTLLSLFVMSCQKKEDIPLKEEEPPKKEDNNAPFMYKALVEYVTGNWCSYCPRAIYGINKIKQVPEIINRVVPVAIHSNKNGNVYNDPMVINEESILYTYFSKDAKVKLGGLPHSMVDRNQRLNGASSLENIDEYFKKNPTTSPIGIKISSQLGEKQGKVSISFQFRKDFNGLKYNVFIVEDKLVFRQYNGTTYYEGKNIQNFEHNDVLRGLHGNPLGNDLGNVRKGKEIVKNDLEVNYNLLSSGKLDNVKVVVFVTDATGTVLNTQQAKANQTIDYQYAK